MATALITGFTGQVGSQMADFLLDKTDYNVIGMMRWQESMDNIYHLNDRINKNDRISVFYADLNDYSSLQRLFECKKPDFIFHLAAQSFIFVHQAKCMGGQKLVSNSMKKRHFTVLVHTV